jgi:1-hydroxy-2-naphthoate dioxygenase
MTVGARKSLDQFDQELAAQHLHGQWKVDALLSKLTDGQPAGAPFIWPWETVHAAMLEACDVLPESMTARRNVTFINPTLSRRGTSQTIVAGMQMVKPREVAWAHRHSISALRFVVDGSDCLTTVVNGEAVPMETNDLILTPSWTWHDHHNESDRNGVWLDVLDSPLVLGLSQGFYEPLGDTVQEGAKRAAASVQRYAWRDVAALIAQRRSAKLDPIEGFAYEYINRSTGGAALTTMSCRLQVFDAGFETQEHRTTASAVAYVVSGSGATIFDDRTIQWKDRDTFVIPNWLRYRHVNAGETAAILFVVSDEPLVTMLGLHREDRAGVRTSRIPVA